MSLGPSAAEVLGGIEVLPTLVVFLVLIVGTSILKVLHAELSLRGGDGSLCLTLAGSGVITVVDSVLPGVNKTHVSGKHHLLMCLSFVHGGISELPLVLVGITTDRPLGTPAVHDHSLVVVIVEFTLLLRG